MTSQEAFKEIAKIYGETNSLEGTYKYFLKIKQDLDRLEKYDNVLNQHCGNCVNKEKDICVGMNSPIGIETLIDCKELMISDCKISIEEQNKKIEKLENLIKQSVELLSIDGKGTKQQVIKLLKEVLEIDK